MASRKKRDLFWMRILSYLSIRYLLQSQRQTLNSCNEFIGVSLFSRDFNLFMHFIKLRSKWNQNTYVTNTFKISFFAEKRLLVEQLALPICNNLQNCPLITSFLFRSIQYNYTVEITITGIICKIHLTCEKILL